MPFPVCISIANYSLDISILFSTAYRNTSPDNILRLMIKFNLDKSKYLALRLNLYLRNVSLLYCDNIYSLLLITIPENKSKH